MGEGSSGAGPAPPPPGGDSPAARTVPDLRSPHWDGPVQPGYAPLRQPEGDTVPPRTAADARRAPGPDAAHQPATMIVARQPQAAPDVVRYGPGVPASQAAAESVWRTGRPPGPPRQARLRRLRRLLGLGLTVILLAAAGVVLWLRFFDHPPFSVTGVHITRQIKSGCAVRVTGEITTNGAAGTISYQWVFRPQTEAPQPLSQSVAASQRAVYVTVAVEGQGHGSATQTVILDVLGPGAGSAPTTVSLSC